MTNIEFIEKEINRLEIILSCMVGATAKQELVSEIQRFQQIKTELKAWEIVKNKNIDMFMFMLYYDNLEEYNNYVKSSLEDEINYEEYLLTQQEAETIKKSIGDNK